MVGCERENSPTIIALAADHGEELGERASLGRHRISLFGEQVHTPLLLSYPGVEPRAVPHRVRNLDLAPTLLALAAVDVPDGFAGTNLLDAAEVTPE